MQPQHEYPEPLGSLPDKPVPQERDMEHVMGFAPYKPRPWHSFPWTPTHTVRPGPRAGRRALTLQQEDHHFLHGAHLILCQALVPPRVAQLQVAQEGDMVFRRTRGGGAAGHRKGCLEPGPSNQEAA